MSLIAARSQWGLSHADWRSVKDQQNTPVPFRLGFSVFILGAGERVWTFDTASLWYAERQDCLSGTVRCYFLAKRRTLLLGHPGTAGERKKKKKEKKKAVMSLLLARCTERQSSAKRSSS